MFNNIKYDQYYTYYENHLLPSINNIKSMTINLWWHYKKLGHLKLKSVTVVGSKCVTTHQAPSFKQSQY